jgi:hypothetical protein
VAVVGSAALVVQVVAHLPGEALLPVPVPLPVPAPLRQEPELPVLSRQGPARVPVRASRPALAGLARRADSARGVVVAPVPPGLRSRQLFSAATARSTR